MLFSILPPAARDIGISPFQVSTVFAISATIWVFVSPWWGRRSDLTGRRRIILNAAMGMGETIGPGVGSLLAPLGITAPLSVSAGLAVLSAAALGAFLPKPRTHASAPSRRPSRLRARDPRVMPFIVVGAALQAVRGTTVITLSLFLQDTLGLTSAETVQRAGMAFVLLATTGRSYRMVLVTPIAPASLNAALMGGVLGFVWRNPRVRSLRA